MSTCKSCMFWRKGLWYIKSIFTVQLQMVIWRFLTILVYAYTKILSLCALGLHNDHLNIDVKNRKAQKYNVLFFCFVFSDGAEKVNKMSHVKFKGNSTTFKTTKRTIFFKLL